jgi:ABC-type lipoprotein release transport system permease subunit
MNRRASRTGFRHRRLQAILAVAALASAVALPVVLLSVGGGVEAHELQALEQAGYQITVSAGGNHGISGAHALSAQIAGLAQVSAASPVLSASIDLYVNGAGGRPVLAEGVIPAAFAATEPPTETSLFPSPLPLGDPTDQVHFENGTYGGDATNDLLLSSPLAESLGLRSGATLGLAATGAATTTTPFTVTGTFGLPPSLLGPTAADAVVLPLSDLQLLVGEARSNGTTGALLDAADTIEVGLVGPATLDPSAVDHVAGEIQSLVPYYSVTSLTQEAQQLQGSEAILTGFFVALSSVSLLVGFLFLVIVLVRRVEAERTAIAIRRAIGIPSLRIAGELLGQGALLGGAGAALGVLGGFAVVTGLAAWGPGDVATIAGLAVFTPGTLGALVLGGVALSLPASGLATRTALKLSVPESLR